jgi:hypothetical protein
MAHPLQPSAPSKKRPTGLIVLMIILALLLIGIIGWLALVNGEYLCQPSSRSAAVCRSEASTPVLGIGPWLAACA